MFEFGVVGSDRSRLYGYQIPADGVGDYKITIGQSLHESRSTQTAGTVYREVGFAQDKQARDIAHQVIVNPEPAHGIVRCWIDTHRPLVSVLVGDLFIHLEQVAITLADGVFAETLDRIGKIEIDTTSAGTDTKTGITCFFGGTGGNITGSQVAVGGVLTFQKIITIGI